MKKVKTRRKQLACTYTFMDVLLASPTNPMPESKRLHQLNIIRMGLHAMENDPKPQKVHWRCISDVANLFETLVLTGEVIDTQGLLEDAIEELAKAAIRHNAGQSIRLSGKGIQACRAMLDDYAQVLCTLPERTMVNVHMKTEKRLQDIQRGKHQKHDVVISI